MQHPPRARFTLAFASISCIMIFHRGLHIIRLNTVENYYSYVGDALPSAEDPIFSPKNKSIFFHETSFQGGLSARQACAVEAAARTHPKTEVYVLFSAPVSDYMLKTTCLAKLLQFPNIKLLRVHIAEYSKDTPVHSILVNDLRASGFPMQHSADILKILTLNKWGGVGVENDMIIAASLDPLNLVSNWIVKEGEKFAAPGILSFANNDAGKNITYSILKEIFDTYDPSDYYVCGRSAIQRVIQRICPVKIHWDSCGDIAIFPYDMFYPIDYTLWKLYYRVPDFQHSFSFRIWDFQKSNNKSVERSPYEKLARKNCPSIFGLYREELGV